MAEPLPPEGYVRLKDAYDTYLFSKVGEVPSLDGGYRSEHADYAEKSDEARRQFVLELGRLAHRGKVISHEGKIYEISGNMFDRTNFADLLLLHNAIPVGISGPLANYEGGIICLNGTAFFEWLQQHLSIHFHGEIQNGDMTPNTANERLAVVNLPALHAMPPLEGFREAVLKEPYWTLTMAVAWIAWSNIDSVVKNYWPYAKHGGHWRDSLGPNQRKVGMVWENADEPTLSALMFFESDEKYDDNPPLKFIKDSREELWRALQSGDLTAIGIEGQGSHKKIASERWASLAIQPQLRGREFVGAGIYGADEKVYDVKLPSKDVLRIWPEAGTVKHDISRIEKESSKQSVANAESAVLPRLSQDELDKKYEERIASWPQAIASPSRDEDYIFLSSISDEVTHKIVRDMRSRLAPTNWTTGGRRKQAK